MATYTWKDGSLEIDMTSNTSLTFSQENDMLVATLGSGVFRKSESSDQAQGEGTGT